MWDLFDTYMSEHPCAKHGERLTGLERDVKHIGDRLDRQDENCVRNVDELKGMIETALSNELRHFRKELTAVKNQMQNNGIQVEIGFWDRIKDPSVILNAIISGGVAIVVAWLYVTFG